LKEENIFTEEETTKIKECAKLTSWMAYTLTDNESCAICFEEYNANKSVIILPCNHYFCTMCIIQCFSDGFVLCPMCKLCYGTRVGTMPDGTFHVDKLAQGHTPLTGYENEETYLIKMNLPDGIQGPEHPNPGKPYTGTSRKAYLPATKEGTEVLDLFRIAWDRKLLFRIGTSVSTGAEDQVVWNGIHMKTNTSGGPTNFGYPDDSYMSRVKQELADKGITPKK